MSVGVLAMLSACDDNDSYSKVDGAAPTITMENELLAEPGRKFTLQATIADNDGLSTIRITNADFYLDKTINLIELKGEVLNTYELNYSYTPDKSFAETDKFAVDITATDVLGNQTSKTVTVCMNGDFTAPSFAIAPSDNITVLFSDDTKLKVNFTAVDDKALRKVTISIPDINYEKEITKFENAKRLVYTEFVSLPSELAEYQMSITLVDTTGLTASKQSVITVSELIDFDKMYLADVASAEDMNSDLFGVPMLVEHGSEPFSYVAHYYASKANQEVRFVPQKTDFEPICFAADPDIESTLGVTYDATEPIVLGEVGYYEIKLNTKDATYSVEKWTPEVVTATPESNGAYKQASLKNANPLPLNSTYYLDDAQEYTSQLQLSLIGSGLPGVGSWAPADPFILTQSTDNPYLFYAEMELEADTKLEFTISPRHDWGWWPEPYWRFESGENNSGENEYNTRNGGNNMTTVTVPTSGKYRFEFDTALLRSKFILIK